MAHGTDHQKMWSSMFILPEHRAAWMKKEMERSRQIRPEFDIQRLEDLSYTLQEAKATGCRVTITVFGDYGNVDEFGWISRIDQQFQRIRLEKGNDFHWIKLADIIDVQVINH